MNYQPQSEHHRQYERTYRLGMHGGWTQGAKWTRFFLILLASLWIAALILPRLIPSSTGLVVSLYLNPSEVLTGRIWQIFTAPFLGAISPCQFWVVLFHLFYLLMFGPKVEREWGNSTFLRFYLVAAFLATLLSLLLRLPTPFALVPASTLSAAIFAVMVVYGANWPRDPVWIFGLFPTPILYVVIALCGIEVLFMVLAPAGELGTDYVASAMGVVIGLLTVKVPIVKVILAGEKPKRKVSAGGRVHSTEFRKRSKPIRRNEPPFPDRVDETGPEASQDKPSRPTGKPSEPKDDKGKRSGFLEF